MSEYSFANVEMTLGGKPIPVMGATYIEYHPDRSYYARQVEADHWDFSINVPFGFVVDVMMAAGCDAPSRYWTRRVAIRRKRAKRVRR